MDDVINGHITKYMAIFPNFLICFKIPIKGYDLDSYMYTKIQGLGLGEKKQ